MRKLFLYLATLFLLFSGASALAKGNDSCAQLCTKCSDMCSKNIESFKKKGGKYADPARISLLEDCRDICKMNADFRTRNSASAAQVDKVCSDICHKCADKCEQLHDTSLKDCIALCRECADSCKTNNN